VSVLQRENSRLLFENSQFRSTLSGLGYSTQNFNVLSNPSPQFSQNESYSFNSQEKNHMNFKSNATITGICLFVILFSFGLFFGPHIFLQYEGAPVGIFENPNRASRALFGVHHVPSSELYNIDFKKIPQKHDAFQNFPFSEKSNCFGQEGYSIFCTNKTSQYDNEKIVSIILSRS